MTERNVSLDILRILACLAVIAYHSPGMSAINRLSEVGTIDWMAYVAYNMLSKWAVPVFMMLTGYFMMQPSKELTVRKLYGKYILRAVTILVFWDVFYMWVNHDWSYHVMTNQTDLWYMGMLIGLYMVMPVLRLLATDIKVLRVFCWTWLGYLCYELIGKFVVLPIDIIDNVFVDSVGYCSWAYYLSVNDWSKTKRNWLYAIGLICLLLQPVAYIINPSVGGRIAVYHSPITALSAMALFLWFLNHPVSPQKRMASLITTLSSVTLGVYVLHPWLLAYTFYKVKQYIPTPVLSVPICVCVTFGIAAIIVLIIKKIPFINKYIV